MAIRARRPLVVRSKSSQEPRLRAYSGTDRRAPIGYPHMAPSDGAAGSMAAAIFSATRRWSFQR